MVCLSTLTPVLRHSFSVGSEPKILLEASFRAVTEEEREEGAEENEERAGPRGRATLALDNTRCIPHSPSSLLSPLSPSSPEGWVLKDGEVQAVSKPGAVLFVWSCQCT